MEAIALKFGELLEKRSCWSSVQMKIVTNCKPETLLNLHIATNVFLEVFGKFQSNCFIENFLKAVIVLCLVCTNIISLIKKIIILRQMQPPEVFYKKRLLLKILPQAYKFIKKETLAQVFSYEFCKIFENTVFKEQLWITVFVNTFLTVEVHIQSEECYNTQKTLSNIFDK